MNTKKFLLVGGITAILLFFAVNISFAANSEVLTPSDYKDVIVYNQKAVSISHITKFDNNGNWYDSYTINVKKAFKNKNKIKAVNVKFSVFEDGTDGSNSVNYNKLYKFKNKDKVTVNIPTSNSSTSYLVNKLTIFYQTKSKLKNESTRFLKQGSCYELMTFKGKKVNIVLKLKGYVQYPMMESWPTITYQHFKVNTLNSKDKIKSVKINYYSVSGPYTVKTIKGYGKSSLSFKFYDKLEAKMVSDIRVRYT